MREKLIAVGLVLAGIGSMFALRNSQHLLEADRVRALLYADQDLDDLVLSSNAKGAEAKAIEHLKAGRPKEAAAVWTRKEMEAVGPLSLLLDALIKQRNNDLRGAEESLRELLGLHEVETRLRLWAAHALRRMGATIDDGVADELLGIVVEWQKERGPEALAAYPDGSVRLIDQRGSIIFHDPGDGRLDDALAAIGEASKAVYMKAPVGKEGVDARPLLERDPEQFRLTFLTPRGPRVVVQERSQMGPGSVYGALFLGVEQLRKGLTSLKK